MRILIIDAFDERDMYAEALAHEGFVVTAVQTGRDGLLALGVEPPDVILVGAMLPDVSTTDLVGQLKAHAQAQSTPVIVLTAMVDKPTVQALRAAGAHAVLAKPCMPDELLGCMRRLLRERDQKS